MSDHISLEAFLEIWAEQNSWRQSVAQTLVAIAEASKTIAEIVAHGELGGGLGTVIGVNNQGDEQKALDIRANDILIALLKKAPVGVIATEELDVPILCNESAPIAVALDPLDGSSNIDTNVSIGTIFSLLPVPNANVGEPTTSFLQPASNQVAAGYVIYGPQCALVLTVGDGTHVFTLDQASRTFKLSRPNTRIPRESREYAINASNQRHWDSTIKAYVEDCVAGRDGPRVQDFNMRWIASLVAECHRILMRGGVFLYPRDARGGYENGRIRSVYEANPIAWLVEQAGGKATNGTERILDLSPTTLHQRTPFVFGSSDEIDVFAGYLTERDIKCNRLPLFNERGLFRG